MILDCFADKGTDISIIERGVMITSINQQLDALNLGTTEVFKMVMIKLANIKLLEWPQPQPY